MRVEQVLGREAAALQLRTQHEPPREPDGKGQLPILMTRVGSMIQLVGAVD